jgi:hypothetical protein
MSVLCDAAVHAAAHGWPVFPCQPRAKLPAIETGFHAATSDLEQVRAWWSAMPRANIGFVPGRAGLIVIDIDGPTGEAAAQRLGLLSEPTLIALTPRGAHRYYKHPGGGIGNRKLADALDVRADRGYVLLPPSIHPSGHRYRWQGRASDIADLPPLARAALLRPANLPLDPIAAPPIEAGTPRRRAYVTAAIEAECLELASTPSGDRNNALNRAAWALARFAETGEADAGMLADVLTIAARHAGLKQWEIDRTIASAFNARGVAV